MRSRDPITWPQHYKNNLKKIVEIYNTLLKKSQKYNIIFDK